MHLVHTFNTGLLIIHSVCFKTEPKDTKQKQQRNCFYLVYFSVELTPNIQNNTVRTGLNALVEFDGI